MENFKHSKEAKNLKGFDRKFYDAIVRLAAIVCDGTGAKIEEVKVTFEGEAKVLKVSAIIDTKSSLILTSEIAFYSNIISKHFPALFTPTHYRPYAFVEAAGRAGIVEILGMYNGGV